MRSTCLQPRTAAHAKSATRRTRAEPRAHGKAFSHSLMRPRSHASTDSCTHARMHSGPDTRNDARTRARALAQLEIAWSRRLFSVVAAPDFFGEDGILADNHIRTYTVRARSGTQTAARKTNTQRAKRPALRDTGARRLARAQRTDAVMLRRGAPDRPNENEPSPPARRSRQSRTRGGCGGRCVR